MAGYSGIQIHSGIKRDIRRDMGDAAPHQRDTAQSHGGIQVDTSMNE